MLGLGFHIVYGWLVVMHMLIRATLRCNCHSSVRGTTSVSQMRLDGYNLSTEAWLRERQRGQDWPWWRMYSTEAVDPLQRSPAQRPIPLNAQYSSSTNAERRMSSPVLQQMYADPSITQTVLTLYRASSKPVYIGCCCRKQEMSNNYIRQILPYFATAGTFASTNQVYRVTENLTMTADFRWIL